jgi:hypothetical protein
MNDKKLASNKPYKNVVSIRYELWKIHINDVRQRGPKIIKCYQWRWI